MQATGSRARPGRYDNGGNTGQRGRPILDDRRVLWSGVLVPEVWLWPNRTGWSATNTLAKTRNGAIPRLNVRILGPTVSGLPLSCKFL